MRSSFLPLTGRFHALSTFCRSLIVFCTRPRRVKLAEAASGTPLPAPPAPEPAALLGPAPESPPPAGRLAGRPPSASSTGRFPLSAEAAGDGGW